MGESNHIAFNNSKDDMMAFTRRRNADMRRRLAEARISARMCTMRFNVEATKWLGMSLDTDLQFWAHKNISLEKAKRAEDWVRRLRSR